MTSIHATRENVQARQRRTAVRCRRCGKVLTAPDSIAARIGPDCAAVENGNRAGLVVAGWKLSVGDWVTWWHDETGAMAHGEIIGYDGMNWGQFRVKTDDDGEPNEVVSVSRYDLTFAGVEKPCSALDQRRQRIIETAKQHRTGGLAILVALMDTPHQRAFAAELSEALFPNGEEVST